MPHSQPQPRRSALRRNSGAAEIRRLEAQVQELLRQYRVQEQRLHALEAEVAQVWLGRSLTCQPGLGIDL